MEYIIYRSGSLCRMMKWTAETNCWRLVVMHHHQHVSIPLRYFLQSIMMDCRKYRNGIETCWWWCITTSLQQFVSAVHFIIRQRLPLRYIMYSIIPLHLQPSVSASCSYISQSRYSTLCYPSSPATLKRSVSALSRPVLLQWYIMTSIIISNLQRSVSASQSSISLCR